MEKLFYDYCNGTATPEERRRVESIVKSSPSAKDELDLVAEAVALEKQIRELKSYDTAAGLQKFIRTVDRRSRFAAFRRNVSRIAAILSLPLLVSTTILSAALLTDSDAGPVYAEVTAAPGSISRFELPDRSKVWLNAGSTLRYPVSFRNGTREVTLTGEGYFEVESEPESPFLVATGSGVKIMAYGTRFNVDTGDGNVSAVLERGSIKLLDSYHRREIEVRPGEQAVYDGDTRGISVCGVNIYEKLAWKDGKIVFRNASLSEVFRRLSTRYNVNIVLHDTGGLSEKYRARVTFSDETIQQIFTYLEIVAPLKWELSTPTQAEDGTVAKQRIDVWLNN